MSEVCKDTEIELRLIPLSGEKLHGRTSNNSNEVRVDIRTWGFWKQRLQAFFVPSDCRYHDKSLQQWHVMNKQKKKRAYNERLIQVDRVAFTPLVYGNRVPKILLPFGTTDIWKKRPYAVDFK